MDMFVLGELIYNSETCRDMIVDNNIHFYDIMDKSQLVVGESAATCMVTQFAKSPLGKLYVNE
jgi:predicted RNA-binding protein